MIKYRKGDLIAAFKNKELHAIAHQANCNSRKPMRQTKQQ